jgi:hypothetical protein
LRARTWALALLLLVPPIGALAQETGELVIKTKPAGADITFETEKLGKAPVTKSAVPPGKYKIQAQWPDGAKLTVHGRVTAGKTSTVRMRSPNLPPEPGDGEPAPAPADANATPPPPPPAPPTTPEANAPSTPAAKNGMPTPMPWDPGPSATTTPVTPSTPTATPRATSPASTPVAAPAAPPVTITYAPAPAPPAPAAAPPAPPSPPMPPAPPTPPTTPAPPAAPATPVVAETAVAADHAAVQPLHVIAQPVLSPYHPQHRATGGTNISLGVVCPDFSSGSIPYGNWCTPRLRLAVDGVFGDFHIALLAGPEIEIAGQIGFELGTPYFQIAHGRAAIAIRTSVDGMLGALRIPVPGRPSDGLVSFGNTYGPNLSFAVNRSTIEARAGVGWTVAGFFNGSEAQPPTYGLLIDAWIGVRFPR